jgi:hypothetical protein
MPKKPTIHIQLQLHLFPPQEVKRYSADRGDHELTSKVHRRFVAEQAREYIEGRLEEHC